MSYNQLMFMSLFCISILPCPTRAELDPSDDTKCAVLSQIVADNNEPDLYRFVLFIGSEIIELDHYYVSIGEKAIISTNVIPFAVDITNQVAVQCKDRPEIKVRTVTDGIYTTTRKQKLE